jgi:RNA polymerase sigma-70 factor (ECF subfamily)
LADSNITNLIKRSQHGDVDSFGILVNIYQGKVLGLCLKLTGNRSDAEDLAQDVFIKSYSALKGFRREADFGTWLHRITVNMYLNYKKKNSRMNILYIDDPVKTDNGEISREIADSSADPLQEVEEKEDRSAVRQALDSLSPEHKAVLVLREIEGYSYEEIAQITQSSLGTVKSRMNRARLALKDKMTQIGITKTGRGG